MKRIYIAIALIASAFSLSPIPSIAASANDDKDKGVVLSKYVDPDPKNPGQYLITLEAYATGESVTSSKPVPCDIVLVLDVSTSMASACGKQYVLQEMQELTTGDKIGILHTNDYDKDSNCCYKTQYYSRLRYQVQLKGAGDMYNLAYFQEGKTSTYYNTKDNRTTTDEWKKPTGWYRSTSTTISFSGKNWQDSWIKYTPDSSDKIYTDVKIDLLQNAVNSFISEIQENAKTNKVDHKIGVTTFCGSLKQYRYITTATNNHFIVNPQGDTEEQTMSDFVKALHTHMGGSTDHSLGMSKAEELYKTLYGYPTTAELATALNSDAAKNRSQVVVLFTDGDPNDSQKDRITKTLESSYRFKTAGATVYSVGIFTDKTIDKTDIKLSEFLDYTSSDYPNATEYGKYGNPIEGHGTNTHKYYFKAEGAELSSIFEAISKETTGGTPITLDDEHTTIKDVLTPDFVIPDGAAVSKIGLRVDKVVGHSTDGYTFEEDKNYNLSKASVTFPEFTASDGKKYQSINVKGFDFTKDDAKDPTTKAVIWEDGEVKTPGNWVGPRVTGTITKYYGRRLVITIPIEPVADYQGGYGIPTNTKESGIYTETKDPQTGKTVETLVDDFDIPHLDFPSIGIIKRGLKKGESATFTVQRIAGKDKDGKDITKPDAAFNVILSCIETDKPAYAIIKNLPEGTYRVAESKWSWTYNVTEVTVKDGEGSATITPGDGEASASTQVLAKSQTVDWPSDISETVKCVLFTFTNEKKTGDDNTIYAESVVKNQFTGGSVKTTGNVTTNSKTQPGQSTSN